MLNRRRILFVLTILFYTWTEATSNTLCDFRDTVNVSGDLLHYSGFYNHEGTLIPTHLTQDYDYVYNVRGEKVNVGTHKRGCICLLKTCINLCCPWGSRYNLEIEGCEPTSDQYKWPRPLLNVTNLNGTHSIVNIFQKFAVQIQRPCERMFELLPEENDFDEWHLHWDGRLAIPIDDYTVTKNEYCFKPSIVDNSTKLVLHPAICAKDEEVRTVLRFNAYAMLFSVPFMLLTIIVYLWLPELRCRLGKCLICYLLSLIIGNIALSSLTLMRVYSGDNICIGLGYSIYYFFMAAFFWLSVISFDLWHIFCCAGLVDRAQELKRFYTYCIYAWGLPILFTLFTWYAQNVADIPVYLKPGIAQTDFCWFDMSSWSVIIYFYGPIILIILTNLIMFVLTARRIHKTHPDKEKFGLFLRLFIIMGLTWTFEILSYLVGSTSAWSKIFYISDLLNASQGLLIFILFVMRKQVRRLIIDKIHGAHENSIYSTSEQIQMKDVNDKANKVLLNANISKDDSTY